MKTEVSGIIGAGDDITAYVHTNERDYDVSSGCQWYIQGAVY